MGDDASLYALKFTDRLTLLSQQMESRLVQAVDMGDYRGSEGGQVVDQLSPIEVEQKTTRFPAMTPDTGVFDQRWVYPDDWDRSIWRDKFDEIRTLVDTQPQIARALVAAMNRRKDKTIIDAFFADAKTGKQGGTTTTFNTSTTVADVGNRVVVNFNAAANTNLTVEKLIEAQRALLHNEVNLDYEKLSIAITASQHASLLREAQVISRDFNDNRNIGAPVLQDGKITHFMGFDFIHTEQLPVTTGVIRRCPVWAKSGMHFGVWMDVQTDISQIKDRRGLPWRIYTMASFGATRVEEKKVFEILCDET